MINVDKIRKDFNVYTNDPNLVYLDTAASSLKPNQVIDEIVNYYKNYGVNINRGIYTLSYESTMLYENSRKVVAEFINSNEDEIIFTSGTSDSLNLIANTYGRENIKEGDEIIVNELEHHSSILPWISIARDKGAVLKYIPLVNGRITVEEFKKVISNKTKVVAITQLSNLLGYETPIKEIIEIAHKHSAVVSVDGAQGIAHMDVDVKELNCDFYSFSAHKICGPTGVGICYGKKELLKNMNPLKSGGDMNDDVRKDSYDCKIAPAKFETGTPNISGVIGLAKAIDYIKNIGMDNIKKYEMELYNYAMKEFSKHKGITIYNKDSDSGILAFNIDDVHPHDVSTALAEDNVCVRAGHHCAQLGIKYLGCNSLVRASFYFYNNKNDIDKLVESVIKTRDFFNFL